MTVYHYKIKQHATKKEEYTVPDLSRKYHDCMSKKDGRDAQCDGSGWTLLEPDFGNKKGFIN